MRVGAISLRRSSVNMLDGLNLAALSYAASLLLLVGFESHEYLTLPVQWVTVLDLGIVWARWISPVLQQRSSARWAGALGSAIVLGSIGIDHLHHHSYTASVSKIKVRQRSWLEAYNAIDVISAPMRTKGETINLIYIKGSWFKAQRHLSRLRFDRLVDSTRSKIASAWSEESAEARPTPPKWGTCSSRSTTTSARCNPYWIAGPANWSTKTPMAKRMVASTEFSHHDDPVRKADAALPGQ